LRRRNSRAVLIRPANDDDVPSIRALELQAENAAHWAEREYEALFAPDAPARIALVAYDEAGSGVVPIHGFLIAQCALGGWEIENVVVTPARRRCGIGTSLIQQLLLRARKQGATSVLLEVRESNRAARRLYEKIGFSEQGRRRDYYKEPLEDALVLRIFVAAS
jgi:[ribosomal protein S18]-alanine N-acetyltransferase